VGVTTLDGTPPVDASVADASVAGLGDELLVALATLEPELELYVGDTMLEGIPAVDAKAVEVGDKLLTALGSLAAGLLEL